MGSGTAMDDPPGPAAPVAGRAAGPEAAPRSRPDAGPELRPRFGPAAPATPEFFVPPEATPPEATPPAAPGGHHRSSRSPGTLPRGVAAVLAVVTLVGVACVVAFGSVVAVRSSIWNPVDEGAHFAYVQHVAEHGSLPVLGETTVSEQVLALGEGVYPRHVSADPAKLGLVGQSYEAFQPPLYYLLAVPAYSLSADFHTKVVLVRFFDLLLLLVTIGLYLRLCRLVLGDRWLLGMAPAVVVLAMPGVVVRCVTVSNLPLAMVLVVACTTELWLAVRRAAPARLLSAGALLGLGALTDLFVVELVPVWVAAATVVLWRRRGWRPVAWAAGGAVVAGGLVTPWLLFNEAHYHALTASHLAKAMQMSTVNPHHVHYGLHTAADLTVQWLFSPVVPQELTLHGPLLTWGASLLAVFVIPVAGLLAFGLGRRLWTGPTWVLVVPFVLNVAACWAITVGEQWLTMLARYAYPTLPLLAVAMGAGAVLVFRSLWPYVVATAAGGALVVGVWVALLPQVHPA